MDILQSVKDFRGYWILLAAILGSIGGVYWWARGILPVVIRLGKGLSKRKIAIFAKSDHFTSLSGLLTASTLFTEKNIFAITDVSDIGEAERATVYLVHWNDWANTYKKILEKKPDGCALIIYARPAVIPHVDMEEIGNHRNTMVTNFRGRLLNDIVTTMITTAYERK